MPSISPRFTRHARLGLEIAVCVAWIIGAVWLCLWAPVLSGWLLVSLSCAELVGVFLVLRRTMPILLGPVSFYDAIRTVRRGRSWVFRIGYALILLLSLAMLYQDWLHERSRSFAFSQPARGMEEIATRFFNTFMVMQFIVVVLLTPLYAASAVTEEKEKRTIDYLMTTHLHSYEIVLGKVASRLGGLLLLLLAGLPVLSMILFLGGVSPDRLLAGFAATFVTALSLASFSVLVSVFNPTTWDAVFRTYFSLFILFMVTGVVGAAGLAAVATPTSFVGGGTAAPGWLIHAAHLGNPAMALAVMEEFGGKSAAVDPLLEVLPGYVLIHLLAAATLCFVAVRSLREAVLLDSAKLPVKAAEPTAWFSRNKQPVGDDALMWKELNDSPVRVPYGRSAGPLVLLIVWMATFLVVWSFGYQPGPGSQHSGHLGWLGGSSIGLSLFMYIVVTISAAGRFSREFEQQTLESLLTVPDREHIFYAKWWGSLMHARAIWWFQSWFLASCLLLRWEPLTSFLAVMSTWVYMAFLASLGMWYSLLTRSTVRAIIWTPVTALLILFACTLAATMVDSMLPRETFGRLTPLQCFKEYSLIAPIGTWIRAFWGSSWGWAFYKPPEELYYLLGTCLYGGLAWLFYRLGKKRFLALAGPVQSDTATVKAAEAPVEYIWETGDFETSSESDQGGEMAEINDQGEISEEGSEGS